jgi:hypothetical protein
VNSLCLRYYLLFYCMGYLIMYRQIWFTWQSIFLQVITKEIKITVAKLETALAWLLSFHISINAAIMNCKLYSIDDICFCAKRYQCPKLYLSNLTIAD